jgi:hypothetical protein
VAALFISAQDLIILAGKHSRGKASSRGTAFRLNFMSLRDFCDDAVGKAGASSRTPKLCPKSSGKRLSNM